MHTACRMYCTLYACTTVIAQGASWDTIGDLYKRAAASAKQFKRDLDALFELAPEQAAVQCSAGVALLTGLDGAGTHTHTHTHTHMSLCLGACVWPSFASDKVLCSALGFRCLRCVQGKLQLRPLTVCAVPKDEARAEQLLTLSAQVATHAP